jgi:putative oxidoreductase
MLDERTAPYGILLLRVALGAFFWAHIYLKFFIYPGGFHQWWRGFNFPAHRNLRVSEGVENLLR